MNYTLQGDNDINVMNDIEYPKTPMHPQDTFESLVNLPMVDYLTKNIAAHVENPTTVQDIPGLSELSTTVLQGNELQSQWLSHNMGDVVCCLFIPISLIILTG